MPKTAVIAAASGLSVAAIVGGGFAAATFLSGGGAQPEDVMPANTLAFVKVDLDPAAGQKINAYKIAKKFDSVDAKSADTLRDDLLGQVFADDSSLDYDTDVKPWLGDRAALAVVPHAEDGAAPLAVVQFTDEDKMRASMAKVEKNVNDAKADYESLPPMGEDLEATPAEPGEEFGWAVRDDYVLISVDQDTADAAAESDDLLVDDADYLDDMKAIEGDQIVTGWMDLGATYAAVPSDVPGATDLFGATAPEDQAKPTASGSVVMGVSAQSDHVEMVAKAIDVTVDGVAVAPAVDGTGMVSDFPADTLAAMSVSGLGESLTTLYEDLGAEADELGLGDAAETYGVVLPDDLAAVFGTDLAVGMNAAAPTPDQMGADYEGFAKVRTADAERAVTLLNSLDDMLTGGGTALLEARDDHYIAATSTDALASVDAGGLGGDASFKKVVATPDANVVGFVDLASLIESLYGPGEDVDADLAPLDALGISIDGDASNSTLTARLSVR